MADLYARDLLGEDLNALGPDDEGLRNVIDLYQLARQWGGPEPLGVVAERFPELQNPDIELQPTMEMYRRFGHELLAARTRYPSLGRLVQ